MALARVSDASLENIPQDGISGTFSAISWGAILAGAAGAAALSLLLLLLGAGFGLSVVSPWPQAGATAATIGVTAIIWLSFTQLAASGLGGYLAGRLRTKWKDVQRDEVYFRDTVHGFLAWAVATIAMATLLTSAITATIDAGMQAGGTMAQSTNGNASTSPAAAVAKVLSGDEEYFIDSLFRREPGAAMTTTDPSMNRSDVPTDVTSEIGRIFNNSMGSGAALPQDDVRYVGQLVAQRTGLSQQDAERRVTVLYTRAQERMQQGQASARETADQVRRASAYTALWLSLSLLLGAFVSSLAATYGGRRRDL